jgi:hypothetical protein
MEQTMNASTTKSTSIKMSVPSLLLRLEGGAVFIAAAAVYASQSGSALLFIALLFAPDLAMIGYLANPRIGAMAYNAVHTIVVPLALIGLTLWAGGQIGVLIGLIWLAHIGMDRTLGYGLKYASAFKDTHLQRV